ncbi:sulfurtransferase [Nonomuraea sp. NPDC050536]|uniref:sulfurtransferase n=1 Tax=Nonomuraea sp. NPDC050536 TaxID=3364366 RepID=UPI0037CB04AF
MSRDKALVDIDWAQAHLNDPGVVLVEVDEDTTAYDRGHITGAVRLDWTKELQDPVRRQFVDKAGFERLMSGRGIARDHTVVLYGGNNNWFAAYAYWYLKIYGHPDVRLLNGGRMKWELEGGTLVTEVPERQATDYVADEPRGDIRALRDDVLASIGKDRLIDVRSPDEYTGRLLAPAHLPQESAQRPGHIPSAMNVPWSRACLADGTFKADAELRALYGEPDEPVIAYCRIGERSAHTWFVLHELLDHPDVRNYDGSWTEYGSLVGVPIELGDGRIWDNV